jgi:predicted nuclease with TOPRIM domain
MSEQYLTILLALIGSGAITAILTSLLNRRHSSAITEDVLVGAAKKLVDELQEDVSRLRQERSEITKKLEETEDRLKAETNALKAELKELKAEFTAQENAIDNLQANALKYQLVLSITVLQLRQLGLEPLIPPDEIDIMDIDDIRLIAQGLSNVEQRRQERRKNT